MAEFVIPRTGSQPRAYDEGIVGSRKLMHWEVGMTTADRGPLARAAAQPHDRGFMPFAERHAAGIPVEVVVDGFGFFIELAWRRSASRGSWW